MAEKAKWQTQTCRDIVGHGHWHHLLAAPSTPEEARDEIIERAKAGKNVSVADVKESVTRARISDKSKRTPMKVEAAS
jgi:hypothetical protein